MGRAIVLTRRGISRASERRAISRRRWERERIRTAVRTRFRGRRMSRTSARSVRSRPSPERHAAARQRGHAPPSLVDKRAKQSV